jgi:hypothetical protein
MSVHLENFRLWFVRVLEGLYQQREAGFAIMMISFPLLDRYLRQKSATWIAWAEPEIL